MGYFDKAMEDIVELDEEEYLAHGRFGSFRKKHKYIDRMWKNGRWVYRYAKKNVGGRISGQYYEDKADELDKEANAIEQERYKVQDATLKLASNEHKINNPSLRKTYDDQINSGLRYHGELNDKQIATEHAARDNHKKAEKSIGNKITGNITKERIKEAEDRVSRFGNNLGDEDDLNRAKDRYGKTLAGKVEKIKKKLKHDDILDSLAYGEAILHSMFN